MSKSSPPISHVLPTQADVAELFGHSLPTVQLWAKQGMPGSRGRYEVGAIIRWLRFEGPWRPHSKSDGDPDLDEASDSPGLERYRMAKAELAEFELEQKKRSLLSTEKARAILGHWASIVRQLGERLGQHFGADAAVAVNDALGECQRVIDHELGPGESADSDAAQ